MTNKRYYTPKECLVNFAHKISLYQSSLFAALAITLTILFAKEVIPDNFRDILNLLTNNFIFYIQENTQPLVCLFMTFLGVWFGAYHFIQAQTKTPNLYIIVSIPYIVFVITTALSMNSFNFSIKYLIFLLATLMIVFGCILKVTISKDKGLGHILWYTVIPIVIGAGSLLGVEADNKIVKFKKLETLSIYEPDNFNFKTTKEIQEKLDNIVNEIKKINRPNSDLWIVGGTDPDWDYEKKYVSPYNVDIYTKINYYMDNNDDCRLHSNVELGFLRAFIVRQKLIENTDVENYVSKIIISSVGDPYFEKHDLASPQMTLKKAKDYQVKNVNSDERRVKIFINQK